MVYLFLGEDTSAKDQKIAELKDKIFLTKDILNFDYEILHSRKLDPAILKKALMSLPAIAKKRLIVIREIEVLSAQNKEIIIAYLGNPSEKMDVILDSFAGDIKDSFIKRLSEKAKLVLFSTGTTQNVFDMTRAISVRDSAKALEVLSNLLNDGEYPGQIMGGILWFWGKAKEGISRDNYRKGLKAIQAADLNIKRSRLQSSEALELLVVNLCSLAS